MPYVKTNDRVGKVLAATFDSIFGWFKEPEHIRTYKPSDGGWSINEILEHITLTTHFLMIIIRKGCDKALKRAATQNIEEGESDLDKLDLIGQRGSFIWIRPAHMEPKGTKPVSEVLGPDASAADRMLGNPRKAEKRRRLALSREDVSK
jgi:hypothetical protein